MSSLSSRTIERETDTHDEDREDDDEWVVNWDLVEVDDDHLGPYECEDKCETNRQILESIDDTSQSEVEWPEPHDGEYIRRVDDELVLSDCEDSWDRVDCEDEIRCLYEYETHEKWCPIELRIFSDKKCISMEFFLKWDNLPDPFDDETLLRIDLHLASWDELVSCIEEYSTEYIDNPVKILEKWYSGEYEYHTKKYRPKYSPEEDFVLVCFWYREIREYNCEYKYIIHGKCLLDDVPCKELYRLLLSEPAIYESVKYKCQRYPYPRPGECFFHADFCTLAMEHSEIECEHEEDEYVESDPEPDIDFHEKKVKNKYYAISAILPLWSL